MNMSMMPTLQMIRDAAAVLRPEGLTVARQTPVIPFGRLDSRLFIKAENLQNTGSFKIRGAYNKLSNLTPEEASRGVIACSAGNHAQGVAFSAMRLGMRAVIWKHIGTVLCVEREARSGIVGKTVPKPEHREPSPMCS